jgi:ABC-type nitrate/sulfonate/bicarbonate transport system substrate-binding protein
MHSSLTRRAAAALTLAFATTLGWAQAAKPVSLGLAGQSMVASIPRFAKEMGLFEKRGLNVNFVMMDSANATATALIAGSLDYAFSGPGELITARARGRELVAIANTYGGLAGSLVLAKSVVDKLGVAANAPMAARLKALNGLTIAAPSATSAFAISYKAAAKSAGAELRMTYMAQNTMAAALESGAIQGYVSSAPFWAYPLLNGKGVMWVSGPKGDLPAELRPRSTSVLLTTRAAAKASPELTKNLAGVFSDFADAIDQRPADVKAAILKVMPNLDNATLDMLFNTESQAWKARMLTAQDMAHEIAYVKAGGTNLPSLDGVDPASLLWP